MRSNKYLIIIEENDINVEFKQKIMCRGIFGFQKSNKLRWKVYLNHRAKDVMWTTWYSIIFNVDFMNWMQSEENDQFSDRFVSHTQTLIQTMCRKMVCDWIWWHGKKRSRISLMTIQLKIIVTVQLPHSFTQSVLTWVHGEEKTKNNEQNDSKPIHSKIKWTYTAIKW